MINPALPRASRPGDNYSARAPPRLSFRAIREPCILTPRPKQWPRPGAQIRLCIHAPLAIRVRSLCTPACVYTGADEPPLGESERVNVRPFGLVLQAMEPTLPGMASQSSAARPRTRPNLATCTCTT